MEKSLPTHSRIEPSGYGRLRCYIDIGMLDDASRPDAERDVASSSFRQRIQCRTRWLGLIGSTLTYVIDTKEAMDALLDQGDHKKTNRVDSQFI